MRIGFVPSFEPSWGGIYQYSLTMLHTLCDRENHGCEDEFVVFTQDHERHHPEVMSLNGRQGWTVKPLAPPAQPPSLGHLSLDVLRRIIGEGPHREAWRRLRRQWKGNSSKSESRGSLPEQDVVQFRPEMNRWFRDCGIELMLYPWHDQLSFQSGIPYVVAIHDVQHFLHRDFPDVWEGGMGEVIRYATLVLADSEVGKEDILTFYGESGLTPDRVRILPFLPACYLAVDIAESECRRVRMTYQLPERYLFYPAQFWPHKNHAGIVQALALLKQEQGLEVAAVFCGAYAEEIQARTFHELMALVRQLGLQKQIYYLGYVPDRDMSGLYAGALALIMPTFFGPTNIPPLEAWSFGCPVITSDIRGIREQMRNAAILVDPAAAQSIAAGIARLWADRSLRDELISRGRARLSEYTPAEYSRRLQEVLDEAKRRIRSGRTPKFPVSALLSDRPRKTAH